MCTSDTFLGGQDMCLGTIARSLSGALFLSVSAFADGLPPLPASAPVNVTNSNPTLPRTGAKGVARLPDAADVAGSSKPALAEGVRAQVSDAYGKLPVA